MAVPSIAFVVVPSRRPIEIRRLLNTEILRASTSDARPRARCCARSADYSFNPASRIFENFIIPPKPLPTYGKQRYAHGLNVYLAT